MNEPKQAQYALSGPDLKAFEHIWTILAHNLNDELASLVVSQLVTSEEAITFEFDKQRTFKMCFLREQALFKSTKDCYKRMRTACWFDLKAVFDWLLVQYVLLCEHFGMMYLCEPFDLVAEFGKLDWFKNLVNVANAMQVKGTKVNLELSEDSLNIAIKHGHLNIAKYIVDNTFGRVVIDDSIVELTEESFIMAVGSDSIEMCDWILSKLPYLTEIAVTCPDLHIKSKKMLRWMVRKLGYHKRSLISHVKYQDASESGDLDLFITLSSYRTFSNSDAFKRAFYKGICQYSWQFKILDLPLEELLCQFYSELDKYGLNDYAISRLTIAASCNKVRLLEYFWNLIIDESDDDYSSEEDSSDDESSSTNAYV